MEEFLKARLNNLISNLKSLSSELGGIAQSETDFDDFTISNLKDMRTDIQRVGSKLDALLSAFQETQSW